MNATGKHARSGRAWYRLPLPLAALFAVAMPWVAVREVRRSEKSFEQLARLLAMAYQRGQLGRLTDGDVAMLAAAPRPRHLYLVR